MDKKFLKNMKKTRQNFRIQSCKLEAEVRNEQDDKGMDVMVIPAVILGQDVIYGAYGYDFGAELVSENAIWESVSEWDDIPIVVYHTSSSARTLENIEEELVGRIYNSEIIGFDEEPKNIRIKCDLHLYRDKLNATEKGRKVLNLIDSNKICEVSTGYYLEDWLFQEGEFKGKQFSGIQIEITPNHLALLPDMVGAYSVEQGGGANRKNSTGVSMKVLDKLNKLGIDTEPIKDFKEEDLEKVLNSMPQKQEKPETTPVEELVTNAVAEAVKPILEKFNAREQEEIVENKKADEKKESLIKEVLNARTDFEEDELKLMKNESLEKLIVKPLSPLGIVFNSGDEELKQERK